ncbi:MAG: cation-translocating P-type ATPase [Coriobacteriia bacterium]|nr:cation-translocating P-type ATPase [Coriobacteriia bacterium]
MEKEQLTTEEKQIRWYEPPVQEIISKLKTNPETGLSESRVAELREQYGRNVLEEEKKEGFVMGVIRHLSDVSIIILLFAAAISYYIAYTQGTDYIKASVILGIVILNLFLAMTQEGRAERALAALEELTAPNCTVIRDGQRLVIDTADLVPGDIIALETGSVVPADARLIESASLFSDEAALTGESVPAEKNAGEVISGTVLAGDQLNMVFSSCVITAGNGLAVVVSTGMNTEIGRIAESLKGGKRAKTPLQKRLDGLGRIISYVAITSAVFLFALGVWRGEPIEEMLLVAVALAVAAVPEMLALTVTLTLTTAVQRMAKKNALIRKLPAVETLGNASVICSDKTGTLTLNQMTITQLWGCDDGVFAADDDWEEKSKRSLLRSFARASNATIEVDAQGEKTFMGDATEVGIMKLLDKKELADSFCESYERVEEIPFSSERKKMSVIMRDKRDDSYIIVTKGALDWLPLCADSNEKLAEARKVHDQFAAKALRVLAIAGRRLDTLPAEEDLEQAEADLDLYGLIGLIDPPRPEVLDAVQVAKRAGIRTVMITGDHAMTAKAIAEEIDIIDEGQCVVTGAELADMSDDYLTEHVKEYSVYARVSPEDKLRIVKAWQKNEAVVAMTGDGVNDAPALNVADVGVAMGITGTEVAKGASDMILTDDNFATIVDAVREGRNVFRIVKKVILFLFACNLSEVAIMLIGQVAGWGLVLTPIMLLLINVVGDGIPGLRLANEPANPNLMHRKPVAKDESFFGGGISKFLARQVVFFTISGLLGYWYGAFLIPGYGDFWNHLGTVGVSDPLGQTLAFLAIGWSSILHIFNARSSKSIFKKSVRDNWPLFWLAMGMVVLFGVFIASPFFQRIFQLSPLTWDQWFWGTMIALMPTAMRELMVQFDRIVAARRKAKGVNAEEGLDLG